MPVAALHGSYAVPYLPSLRIPRLWPEACCLFRSHQQSMPPTLMGIQNYCSRFAVASTRNFYSAVASIQKCYSRVQFENVVYPFTLMIIDVSCRPKSIRSHPPTHPTGKWTTSLCFAYRQQDRQLTAMDLSRRLSHHSCVSVLLEHE